PPRPRNFPILLLQFCAAASRIRHRNAMKLAGYPAGSTASALTANIHETNLFNGDHRFDRNRTRAIGQCAVIWTENEETERTASKTGAVESKSGPAQASDARQRPYRRVDSQAACLFDDRRT